MILPYLFKAVALGFSAAAMPGASQAYLINQAALYGWRRAFLVSLAPLVADGPIILISVLVLSIVPAWVLSVLQIVGAVFIFYLVYRSFRGLLGGNSETAGQSGTPNLLTAVTINLLNPVIYLYWSTVSGPIFVQGWRISPAWGIGYLVCFYGIMVLTLNGIILVIHGLRTIGRKVRLGVQVASICLLVVMGIIQLVSGIDGLL